MFTVDHTIQCYELDFLQYLIIIIPALSNTFDHDVAPHALGLSLRSLLVDRAYAVQLRFRIWGTKLPYRTPYNTSRLAKTTFGLGGKMLRL